MKKLKWIFIAGICIVVLSACSTNSQKKNDQQSNAIENTISEELHQAHCDLLAKANEELANINGKVRDLNDKIKNGEKLTDAQNTALDEFEVKQASINKRMHEIKNIKQEDWENFRTTFENDMKDINTTIDKILSEF
ncbi:hypothetical protein INQ51_13180 [Maribellus sp. CM-23]|uniref:hypothetical protein n=1 Tax=Maribellus sp. CM-23 TaxID=2781026 RepID=UPI001F3BFD1C|nr:hypothetical protein [Maribellus sp. CM-23]MCE4565263.1 hypothetical protein [Maribellus sp. CM-23]